MELDFKKNENVIIIYLQGNLDIYFTASTKNEFNELISVETTKHFLVNLENVNYISSSGLGILISIMATLKKRDRKLVFCNMNDTVGRIFTIVKFNEMFDIFNTENEAIAFLKKIE